MYALQMLWTCTTLYDLLNEVDSGCLTNQVTVIDWAPTNIRSCDPRPVTSLVTVLFWLIFPIHVL